ncbi:branched-subunit amino acid transport protein [Pseudomonas sp. GGS8]|uniref:AzlD domain-containing protein n=1 Tax=Pseudomonas sp. GGS8 TaxID=2817892 RepID=UPI0020A055A0|nr:AzlD domain-containing protein [Pseudomonas sp. GGS8]MCP1442203.1 branched-subunit amino acid transport protein [Pseudomonas sp. GGS8]
MPDQTFLILVVVLMMAVTFLPRALPLQVNTDHWPPLVARALEYLPVAIVAAISLTPLLIKDQRVQLDRPEFYAAIPTLLCAYFSKNLFLSVAVGTAAYIALGSFM